MSAGSTLLGRERESAALFDALERAGKGDPQTVLVSGDAGMGKTTLVRALERKAGERGFTVVTGHCLDIGAEISFAPVVEAVRSLVSGLDDLAARPSARRMLPMLDPAEEREADGVRLLDDLTQTVLEASRAGSLLLVLEDMHWADRSTQDFATALARTARGRLLLVLTFRSDELHRQHPFRSTLAEIGRTQGARRSTWVHSSARASRASSRPAPAGLRIHPSSPPCWPARRATRCTPKSWCTPTRGPCPATSLICCWRGSTPWNPNRGGCCGSPR